MEYEFIEHLRGTNIKILMATIYNRQPHFHNDIEIVMPIQGELYMGAENKRVLLKKSDIMVINRNEAHSAIRTDEQNAIIVLQINPAFCKAYYPKLARLRILDYHITRESDPVLYAHMHAFIRDTILCYGEKKEGYLLEINSILNRGIYDLIQYGHVEELSKEESISEERSRARLSRIIDYIQKNYMYKISLSDLAKSEMLDMTYLSHFISENLGMSFREYVNRLRLDRAVDLLTSTNMRKIDICVECGYSDYRYLNKAVIEEYGCTPFELRERDLAKSTRFLAAAGDNGEQHSIMDTAEAFEKFAAYFKEENANK